MLVHSFESMGARDGEGIRFIVFLAGCPLRCVFCHNPDTWEMAGREYTPEEIAKKAIRYKPYFKSGGGVTFSGGEPLLQSEEIVKTATLLKETGISYALDTSLGVPLTASVKSALLGADMVIADLKFPTEEKMTKYTGRGISHTLDALRFLSENKKRFIIRTVVIPSINDSEEALLEYLPIVEQFSPEYYELLPFHTMGFFKYEKNGIENPLTGTPPMDMEKLRRLKEILLEKTHIFIK